MQATKPRHIKPGTQYDKLIPKPIGNDIVILKKANVADTLLLIPHIVQDTLTDTKRLAPVLKGASIWGTCSNIWHFIYGHIQYKKDEPGIEQVRRPARSWHLDRRTGVDCDCYTVFISSILTNLNIPHTYRVTAYDGNDHYQHIYPIVPLSSGGYITIDPVVNQFNYEEPFSKKMDKKMELHYLNGIGEDEELELTPEELTGSTDFFNAQIDAPGNDHNPTEMMDTDELEGYGIDELGFLKKFRDKAREQLEKSKTGQFINKVTGKVTNLGSKVVHTINKGYPHTVLLRNGMLIGMKINMFNIAGRLRYAYLSDAQAKVKGLDLAVFRKYQKILAKMEKTFWTAGGKPENLKLAILTGKGNKDGAIPLNGLGSITVPQNVTAHSRIIDVLGPDIFYSENEQVSVQGFAGISTVNELGSVETAAAITAATTVLAAIAALLKSAGDIRFQSNRLTRPKDPLPNERTATKGSTNVEDAIEKVNPILEKLNIDPNKVKQTIPTVQTLVDLFPKGKVTKTPSAENSVPVVTGEGSTVFLPPAEANQITEMMNIGSEGDEPEKTEFAPLVWIKANPVKTAAIVGVPILSFIGWNVYKNMQKKKNAGKTPAQSSLSGANSKKKHKTRKTNTRKKKPLGQLEYIA